MALIEVSDDGVVKITKFYHRLKNDMLNIPEPENPMPLYLLVTKLNFLKPFAKKK